MSEYDIIEKKVEEFKAAHARLNEKFLDIGLGTVRQRQEFWKGVALLIVSILTLFGFGEVADVMRPYLYAGFIVLGIDLFMILKWLLAELDEESRTINSVREGPHLGELKLKIAIGTRLLRDASKDEGVTDVLNEFEETIKEVDEAIGSPGRDPDGGSDHDANETTYSSYFGEIVLCLFASGVTLLILSSILESPLPPIKLVLLILLIVAVFFTRGIDVLMTILSKCIAVIMREVGAGN